jgi:hypothetical protein
MKLLLRYLLTLFILTSCQKDADLVVITHETKVDVTFNSEIEKSIWILKEIEFLNNISEYSDTLKFFKDSVMFYNSEITKYEFYNTSNINRELRISTSPVGFIDCQLTEEDLIKGKLIKHPFNNVFNLNNKYKITLLRIK